MRLGVLGTGKYLPKKIVRSTEIDLKLGLTAGTIESKTGVGSRHFIQDETLSQMAKYAATQALENAQLKANQIDLIISAGASPEQIIPCNAVLFQKELGLGESGIACFDIDATCLSFLSALDYASSAIAVGRYKNVLIISSEISSLGLNDEDIETVGLFGDGAVAVIVGQPDKKHSTEIIDHQLRTYSSSADLCQIVGGGSKLPGYEYCTSNKSSYLFQMNGPKLFKQAMKYLPGNVEEFFTKNNNYSLSDVKFVIPHQASGSGMALMRRRLNIEAERWVDILNTHGNCIAASLPMALHELTQNNAVKPGDLLLLIGTGAGISVGMTLLRY
jgi:3-oxoacyl-[acyl-carrier-protein] synthase-3